AHSRGIIHRDIKTANVLFDEDGEAYLSDFGSARIIAATFTSSFAGTPNYMAPEQWAGEHMDARTDVYQMGGLLFEMLTGRIPFEAHTPPALMHKHLYASVPSARSVNPNVPPTFDAVIRRAMAKKQSDRYGSGGEMAADLRNAAHKWKTHTNSSGRLNLSSILDTLRSFGGRVVKKLSHPFWIGLIGGLIILGLATVAARSLAIGPFQDSPTPTQTAPIPTRTATSVKTPTQIPTSIITKSPTTTNTPEIATDTPTATIEVIITTPGVESTLQPTPTPFPTFTPY
ncbi:MAG: protein kinase, partial [Anaerolineales bacterium]|nr:protein kinase [Anaerolineales bacterium]